MSDDVAADPLRQLVVNASEVDRESIAQVLKNVIGIDSDSGRLVLMPDFTRMDARRKVLSVLLARKAAHLLGLVEDESLPNADVALETGLPSGTAAPALKNLRELRLLAQNGLRRYYVPNPKLRYVVEMLSG
jgi:hypothetical protein